MPAAYSRVRPSWATQTLIPQVKSGGLAAPLPIAPSMSPAAAALAAGIASDGPNCTTTTNSYFSTIFSPLNILLTLCTLFVAVFAAYNVGFFQMSSVTVIATAASITGGVVVLVRIIHIAWAQDPVADVAKSISPFEVSFALPRAPSKPSKDGYHAPPTAPATADSQIDLLLLLKNRALAPGTRFNHIKGAFRAGDDVVEDQSSDYEEDASESSETGVDEKTAISSGEGKGVDNGEKKKKPESGSDGVSAITEETPSQADSATVAAASASVTVGEEEEEEDDGVATGSVLVAPDSDGTSQFNSPAAAAAAAAADAAAAEAAEAAAEAALSPLPLLTPSMTWERLAVSVAMSTPRLSAHSGSAKAFYLTTIAAAAPTPALCASLTRLRPRLASSLDAGMPLDVIVVPPRGSVIAAAKLAFGAAWGQVPVIALEPVVWGQTVARPLGSPAASTGAVAGRVVADAAGAAKGSSFGSLTGGSGKLETLLNTVYDIEHGNNDDTETNEDSHEDGDEDGNGNDEEDDASSAFSSTSTTLRRRHRVPTGSRGLARPSVRPLPPVFGDDETSTAQLRVLFPEVNFSLLNGDPDAAFSTDPVREALLLRAAKANVAPLSPVPSGGDDDAAAIVKGLTPAQQAEQLAHDTQPTHELSPAALAGVVSRRARRTLAFLWLFSAEYVAVVGNGASMDALASALGAAPLLRGGAMGYPRRHGEAEWDEEECGVQAVLGLRLKEELKSAAAVAAAADATGKMA